MERSQASLPLSFRSFFVVAGLMAAAGAARAQEAPAHRSLIGTRCKDDAARLCSGVEIGGGKLARCLRLHDSDLSETCKNALAASADKKAGAADKKAGAAPVAAESPPPGPDSGMGGMKEGMKGDMKGGMKVDMKGGMGMPHEWGAMKDMHKSCATDAGKFCKEVPPGHGRVAVCLNEHTAELAPGCKKVVETVMTQMHAHMEMHADCADDMQKLCPDAAAGTGHGAMCLGEHTKELSPACKKHVDEMKAHWKKHMAAAAKAESTSSGAGGAPGTAPAALPPVPPAAPAAPAKK